MQRIILLASVFVLMYRVAMSSRVNKTDLYGKPLYVRCMPELHKAIQKLAKSERRTINNYLTLVLSQHVEEKGIKLQQAA